MPNGKITVFFFRQPCCSPCGGFCGSALRIRKPERVPGVIKDRTRSVSGPKDMGTALMKFAFTIRNAADAREGNPRVLRSGLILFGLAVISLSWGLILYQLNKSKTVHLEGLKREQGNLVSVLSQHLFQILDQKQVIELMAVKGFDGQEHLSLDDITGLLYGGPTFTRIVLYERSGKPFYESSPGRNARPEPAAVAQMIEKISRDSRPAFMDPAAPAGEITWQIPIFFPVTKNKKIIGAMLLELDLGYLLNLLRDIQVGRTGKIVIFSDQGRELARFESGGLAMGEPLPGKVFQRLTADNTGSGIIHYPGAGPVFFSYLHVRNYPFIIMICQETEDFFSAFQQYRSRVIWTLSILTSLCIAGIFFLLKLIDRKYQYLDALAASNEKNSQLIAKLEKEHELSTRAASFDSLTQLYNRRLFVSLARKSLARAKRNKFSYALLFIDLDRFKKINDTLGHRVGDLLLKAVAQRLTACTRKSDIVARIGGDEFVILLTEMSAEASVSPVVEKIISAVSTPYEDLDGHQIITSPSIGIAVYPRDGETIEMLLLHADAAMYKSKQAGRGRYSFFDASLNRVSIEKFELEQRMPAAIDNGEFILHYQPKIRLSDYRVVGLEALVRWHHPEHQLVFPSDFIEIAEETGLIAELGEWVLEAACNQLVRWRSDGLEPVPVSINVSPRELTDQTYAQKFLNTLDRHQIAPRYIELEITENALIRDREMVVSNLEALYSGGVNIFLDDFGKGFSSLEHIRSLPVNALKIDRSFIQDIRNSHQDSPIVSSAIILAHKLDLTVVAEGIETHDQLVNLKLLDCDQVQGYFFSRPVPEQKIREFITSPLRRVSP